MGKRIDNDTTPEATTLEGFAFLADLRDVGTRRVYFEDFAAFLADELVSAHGDLFDGRSDDFDGPAHDWIVELSNGASLKLAGSASAYGFPSRGAALLECSSDSGSKVFMLRPGTGLVLGAADPIVIEFRYFVPTNDAASEWFVGLLGDGGDSCVAWAGLIDTGVRVHRLVTIQGGGAPVLTDLGALPSGTYYDVRLTLTETGTTVEIAADDGAFATLGTAPEAPDQEVYFPWLQMARSTGAGNRGIVVDRVRWEASRTAEHPGSTTGDEFADHVPSITEAERTKLDGIEALADVTDAANVATAIAAIPSPTLGDGTGTTTLAGDDSASLTVASGFVTIASANLAMGDNRIQDIGEPTAGSDATSRNYVDQAPAFAEAAGFTVTSAHIGGIVFMAGSGTAALPDLSSALLSGKAMILTIEPEGDAVVVTVDPGSGVTINGSASNFVGAAGARVSLTSRNGTAWRTGAAL